MSNWLVEAIHPQPGHRVLDLAAGIGETGFLAAELVAPGGSVIISDQAEAMLDAARARAQELGLRNVEFKSINAEWIDLPVASVDAVLCRWGYMLMADPGAALSETRRVLRSGGRLALAVWDDATRNPWLTLPAALFAERGLIPAPVPARPDRSRSAIASVCASCSTAPASRTSRSTPSRSTQRHPNFAAFWDQQLDLSRTFHDARDESAAGGERRRARRAGAPALPVRRHRWRSRAAGQLARGGRERLSKPDSLPSP